MEFLFRKATSLLKIGILARVIATDSLIRGEFEVNKAI